MKHLRKFNESIDDPQYLELMDNFSYICDSLGDPKTKKSKWGTNFKYILQWELGLNLYDLQDPKDIVEKLQTILKDFDDIVAASERESEYNIKMSIGNNVLNVEATPKDLGDDKYQFIIGQNWREVRVNITDIERFLNRNGVDIKTKNNIDEYETNGIGWVDINTTEIPNDVRSDFKSKFNTEMRSKMIDRIDYNRTDVFQSNIDREIDLVLGQNFIKLWPIGEKTFITI